MLIERGELQSGNLNGANLGQINVAGTVHAHVPAEIDLTPDTNSQLIVGTNHIIWRNGSLIAGRKRGGNAPKQVFSVDGQELAGGLGNELLILRRLIRWKLLLLL